MQSGYLFHLKVNAKVNQGILFFLKKFTALWSLILISFWERMSFILRLNRKVYQVLPGHQILVSREQRCGKQAKVASGSVHWLPFSPNGYWFSNTGTVQNCMVVYITPGASLAE